MNAVGVQGQQNPPTYVGGSPKRTRRTHRQITADLRRRLAEHTAEQMPVLTHRLDV
ncbi:MAG: hypothetical protein ACRCUY_03920 [Thermoguttaceae bacterium]